MQIFLALIFPGRKVIKNFCLFFNFYGLEKFAGSFIYSTSLIPYLVLLTVISLRLITSFPDRNFNESNIPFKMYHFSSNELKIVIFHGKLVSFFAAVGSGS